MGGVSTVHAVVRRGSSATGERVAGGLGSGGLGSGDVDTGQPGLVGVVAVNHDRTVAQERGDALLGGGVQLVVGSGVIDGSWRKYQ